MKQQTAAAKLPALRDEIRLHPGPDSAQGEPTWSLHDPLRNLYFRIDWLTFEVLCRWSLEDPALILISLKQDTTLRIEPEAIDEVVKFLHQHELVKVTHASSTERFCERLEQRKTSPLTWLLHRYLFFRLPLWRPDGWLERTLPAVQWLGSPQFALISMLALLLGLFEVSRQWGSFTSTLVDMFSLSGLLAYGVTLVCVKFLHELGHALTAKHLGCRVPTMGIAFLVMFPMAYTDVNDAWKLPSRKQRLLVGAAGIRTELTIAAWATFVWGFLPDGPLRNGVFLLATTTWISTLLVNASPFLRFDGYFLLMDWLDLPNLHQRAFALARWDLRERLFGWGDERPEFFRPTRHRLLILFSWGTWLYRLVVFIGIAVMVYLMFPKPLGPVLAAIEIGWFILRPVVNELNVWLERKRDIMNSKRSLRSLLLLVTALLVLILPWDSRIHTQALLTPAQSQPVLSPGDARIDAIVPIDGSPVELEQPLFQLVSPDLLAQYQSARARLQGLERQRTANRLDPELHQRLAVTESEKRKVQAELDGLEQQLLRYQVLAEQAGVFKLTSPDLKAGTWVAENEKLGEIIQPDRWQVHGYLPETERDRVHEGDRARFFVESGHLSPVELIVVRIDTDATRVLADAMLASTRGGELLVREQGDMLIPEQALYRLTLELAPGAENRFQAQNLAELRGKLVVYGERRAWGWQYWRTAAALLRRELGF
ncbi:HlyD family efflux transporter periplasmic adaptor subunit [Marinobacterium sediminicola]|uniref:Peptide zinc metalloprotease protein n=1 Tax=Marinobacterium sediminicola TaxID=518898 RepID=A0ABY1RWA8_9GAMM|nr:HlyD family efflux transporter periplasmic adaptor subunit [Marinobacterium sediminicola]ULG70375.1 HlyD family efflux transporter periplasmic adaptor subunit [Marinobacterium sediminicola]SMR69573.1 putative peptide zinc metalloprotease protein [Marinobacterium sediminicola]